MLTALRVTLLALFIAAPVGKQDTKAEVEGPTGDYACSSAPVAVTLAMRSGDEVWSVRAGASAFRPG